jgi:hypothetical protein
MLLPGVEMRACNLQDTDCTAPGPLGGAVDQTDTMGRGALWFPTLTGDGKGYLKLTSDTTMPTYWYWGFALSQSQYVAGVAAPGSSERGLGIESVAEFQSVAQQISATLDAGPSDTALLVWTLDCMHMTAPGVQVTLSPANPQTIALNGNLSPGAPITDSTGVREFAYVPAGPVIVTATPTAIGKPSGTVQAAVRAGAVTVVVVGPTPL